ncbi:MAG: hypothetical protein AAGF12_00545 [Myxococcota bacterium]
MRVLVVAGLVSLAGCAGSDPTYVVVHLGIPDALRERTNGARLVVEYGETVYDRRFDATTGLPEQLPVVPGFAPPSARFRVTITLLDMDSAPIAVARADVGLRPGDQRNVWLRVDDRCGLSCPRAPWETCVAGRCIPACVSPSGDDGGPDSPTPLGPCVCRQAPLSVAAGREGGCAVWGGEGCSSLWCWGEEPLGPGDGEPIQQDSALEPRLVTCSPTGQLCCFIDAGEVGCLGNDGDHLGGAGSRLPGITGAHIVDLGSQHGCALGDSLWCWGNNSSGQIPGAANNPASAIEIAATVDRSQVTDVAAGADHTCVLEAGRVRCWGSNRFGELGLGEGVPVNGPDGPLDAIVDIAAGGSPGRGFSCAVGGDGQVYCWGQNDRRQLGTTASTNCPDVGSSCSSVALRIAGVPPVEQVEVGAAHACARTPQGEVFCWGSGAGEALGFPDQQDRETPVQVADLQGAIDLALGDRVSCALTREDAVCWGENQRTLGSLGAGTTGPERRASVAPIVCPGLESCP